MYSYFSINGALSEPGLELMEDDGDRVQLLLHAMPDTYFSINSALSEPRLELMEDDGDRVQLLLR